MKKLLSAFIALLVVLTFSGCSGKTPTSVASAYLDEMKSNILSADFSDLDSDDMFGGDEELEKEFASMLESFEYTVENENIEDDLATVDVTVTTYDFGSMFQNYIADYFTKALSLAFTGGDEDAIKEASVSIITEKMQDTKEEGKTSVLTVTLQLNKTDDGWAVDEEYNKAELANAVTGGMYDVFSSMSDSFSN